MSNLVEFLLDLASNPQKQEMFEKGRRTMLAADQPNIDRENVTPIPPFLLNELATNDLASVMGAGYFYDPGPDPEPDPDPPPEE
jgi:hypothetical protein